MKLKKSTDIKLSSFFLGLILYFIWGKTLGRQVLINNFERLSDLHRSINTSNIFIHLLESNLLNFMFIGGLISLFIIVAHLLEISVKILLSRE